MSCQADAPPTAEPEPEADEQASQRQDQPQARRARQGIVINTFVLDRNYYLRQEEPAGVGAPPRPWGRPRREEASALSGACSTGSVRQIGARSLGSSP